LAATESALLTHLAEQHGGEANIPIPKRILCERIAADLLRLEQLDQQSINGTISDFGCRIAHALRNSVRLSLRECGLDAPGKAADARVFLDTIARMKQR
jgi:hypothetical protein